MRENPDTSLKHLRLLADEPYYPSTLKVGSGVRFAIELKVVEARRGDYTQLTSYMGNLESGGVPSDKVRGVLVAPGFSGKVMSSASIEPRITPLRFDKGRRRGPRRAGPERAVGTSHHA